MLGRFLEISLPAPEILRSWEFYQGLGFTSASVGEIWPYRYAAVSDGRLALGLHAARVEEPLLCFVRPELARHLPALADAGVDFTREIVGDEEFNEAAFTAPDAQPVRLLEARTFSPPIRPAPTALGWFEEYMLPVADLAEASAYWERIGFVTAAEGEEPWPHLALTSDSLNLGLYRTSGIARPTLRFGVDDLGRFDAHLESLGIRTERRLPAGMDPATHRLIVAPEGTRLLVGPSAD